MGPVDAVRVRPLRRVDLPGVVELFRVLWPWDILTADDLVWQTRHASRSERIRRWVAIVGDRVVGYAAGGLEYMTVDCTAFAWFGVLPDARRHGVGERLYRALDNHLAALGSPATWSGCAAGDEESAAFLRRRGFRQKRANQVWSLDPRTVDTSDLPDRLSRAEAGGFRLAPLRDLEGRPRDLFDLYLACDRDAPWDDPIGYSYAAWRRHSFARPLVDRDGSFYVLAGDRPVSQAWLLVDRDGRRAANDLTGTHPDFRRRGLAHLVKLVTIRWMAEQGIAVIHTDNDTTNRDMLALNEHLGYRRLLVVEDWLRGEATPAG